MSEIEPNLVESYKSEPLKAQVVARFISGESKSFISRELHIARDTVTNIIANSKLGSFVERGNKEVLMLIPRCYAILEQALDSDDERIRLQAACKVLTTVGILSDRIQVEKAPEVDWTNLSAPVYEQSKEKPN